MTKRINQVNQLIKKELSQIVLKEFECPPKVLLTITRVEASANLQEARVYVSCLPEEFTEKALESLNRQIYKLQQKLNHRLKMRPVPRIYFVEEEETVKAGRIEEILEKIKKKKGLKKPQKRVEL